MTANMSFVLSPISGSYVPPHRRHDASGCDSVRDATMDKGKGTSTGTYVPPHKANATHFTSGGAWRPAPASSTPKKTAGAWGPSKTPQVPAQPLEDLEECPGSVSLSKDTEFSVPKKTAGVWGPSRTPQAPALPPDDPKEDSVSCSRRTAGTWGPSKTPQVPAAPLEDLDECPSTVSKRTAGTWGPSKRQASAPPLEDTKECPGSGSRAKSTELSPQRKTAGVWGPSRTPQVPAAPLKDLEEGPGAASEDVAGSSGPSTPQTPAAPIEDRQVIPGSALSFESIAYLWDSPNSPEEPAGTPQNPGDDSDNAPRRSIYSLIRSSVPIPRSDPSLNADWGYIGRPLFDPRTERNATVASGSGSLQYTAGSTTAAPRSTPGASSRTASSPLTARYSPSQRSPVFTTASSSRTDASPAHTSPPSSGSWIGRRPPGLTQNNLGREAVADSHTGSGYLGGYFNTPSSYAEQPNAAQQPNLAAHHTTMHLFDWDAHYRANGFGAMRARRSYFTGSEYVPIYTEWEIEAMDHNTCVSAEAVNAVVVDGNGFFYRFRMASRYQGVENRLYF
ncbi:hypothetical protein F503_07850 [Ophiostoma piceae UAMH 11346]|uniref:Uncharacterized protein n=1 Tax=Ophiostoma piceae (strain UAMH 11346) TaxID=1262450 RepID=S3C118_OPHP1|nr:hypothetical protein F503_07850 [Ophiostoma piceae UAMH 11346]